jgi:hypothetical protein
MWPSQNNGLAQRVGGARRAHRQKELSWRHSTLAASRAAASLSLIEGAIQFFRFDLPDLGFL